MFSHLSATYFGSFSESLLTMFQIATGDAWASAVGRSMLNENGVIDGWAISFLVTCPICLCACYAMSGTDIAVLLSATRCP
eukprot:1689447-Rhodomonas_salina.1